METFYITYEQFWDWFDRDESQDFTETDQIVGAKSRSRQEPTDGQNDFNSKPNQNKRMRMENRPPKTIMETEAGSRSDARYVILYGTHKPGKKNKVWEGDGYLTLVDRMAHLCDLRGRMLEEPTLLDEVDHGCVVDLGELVIGNQEVQVIELDK